MSFKIIDPAPLPPIPTFSPYFRKCAEALVCGRDIYDYLFPTSCSGELLIAYELSGLIPPPWKHHIAAVARCAWLDESLRLSGGNERKWCRDAEIALENAEKWRQWGEIVEITPERAKELSKDG